MTIFRYFKKNINLKLLLILLIILKKNFDIVFLFIKIIIDISQYFIYF